MRKKAKNVQTNTAKGKLLTALGFALVGLCACQQANCLQFSAVALKKITVISKESNEAVIAVRVVFPKTAELYEKLRTMSSAAYFEQHDALANTYPGDFEFVDIPAVPGQQTSVKVKLNDFRAMAAIVFVRYDSKGDHRREIDGRSKKATITVNSNSFELA
ncbi:MAG: hypothetical protein LBF66_02115 [Holosporales bacterium]|jgi:hypothetical protein|nr:hypothetical protein [Holosporales bacterium]